MKRLLLIGWFFAISAGLHEGKVVGPFDNEQKCNEVRAVMSSKTTPCWYFGGVIYEPKPIPR